MTQVEKVLLDPGTENRERDPLSGVHVVKEEKPICESKFIDDLELD